MPPLDQALHYTLEMLKGFNVENLKKAMFATKIGMHWS